MITAYLVLGIAGAAFLIWKILKKPPPPEQPSNPRGEPAKQIASEAWTCSECETENDGLWKLCTDCGVKK